MFVRAVVITAAVVGLTVTQSPDVSAHGRIRESAVGPTFGVVQVQAAHAYQTFVASTDAIYGVSLGLYPLNPGNASVTVRLRSGGPGGPVLAETSEYIPGYPLPISYMEHFEFPVAARVAPGQTYFLTADADAAGPGWTYLNFDAYPDGRGTAFSRSLGDWDLIFQTCGEGNGKPCKEKTKPLDRISRGHGGKGCIDFSSDPCEPF